MHDPFDNGEGGGEWIAYGDFLTTLLGIFLICTVLLIPFIAKPTQSNDADLVSRDSVIVEAIWNDDRADVDLWGIAPGEDRAIGYSNKSGKTINLLRDDRGRVEEQTGGVHYENIFSRNTPAGEYVFNLHMFENSSGKWPIHVSVAVNIAHGGKQPETLISKTSVDLQQDNQEVTVARFRLDQNGKLIPGSLNTLFQPLRADKSGG